MTHDLELIYQAALNAVRSGEPSALVTVVDASGSAPRQPGAKMLVHADGQTVGTIGGGPSEAWVIDQAREALTEGKPRLVGADLARDDPDTCGAGMRFFLDVLLPAPTLLIVGAGHIGQAVAFLGAWLDYRVVVLDERPELLSPERFPQADELVSGQVDESLRGFPVSGRTYAVLVTPHSAPDERALAVLAQRRPGYVGLLGGTRRTKATFKRAREMGVPDIFLKQVHTPIGLDIDAETPREIALSIVADITAVRRQGS